MNISPIEESIRSFIASNLLYSAEIFSLPADVSLLKEGIIDSLGVVELVEFVQTYFSITIKQSEVIPANFDSVANLTAFINRKLTTI